MLPACQVSVHLVRNCGTYEDDYMAYKRFRIRVCACSLLSLVAIVLLASSMIVQITNHSLFSPQTFESSQGDQRLAPVSTFFCQGILLGRDDVARRLLIVPSPRLRPSRQRSNVSSEVFVSKFKYWYKTIYLLKGSSVLIEANSDSAMKLFIFSGRTKLDEWLAQHEEKGLPLDDEEDAEKEDDSARSTQVSYMLSIENTNNYYILFSYSEGKKALARLSLTLTVQRKLYDLQNAIYSCDADAGESCAGRLKFNSAEKAIIEVLGSSIVNDVVNSVTTWKCEPRIWFHLLIFGGTFLVFLVTVIVIYVLILKGKKRNLALKLERMRTRQGCSLSRSGTFRSSIRSNANGSLRRSPSRTPSRTPSRSSSLRSCTSNQPGETRGETRLLPVVTPMYTGLMGSEDSGHETDDESKARPCVATQRLRSSASYDLPSFSTFQGSSDSNSGAWDRASLPRTRSRIARESGFRASCTLPRGRTDSCASEPTGRTYSGNFPSLVRPASLPVLTASPSQRSPPKEQRNPEAKTDSKLRPVMNVEEPDGAKTKIKLRSLSARRREMSWKPRLSMVSEV